MLRLPRVITLSRFASLKTKVTFLSLGPGDPELLTLKAVRVLREADILLLPATRKEGGQLASRAQGVVAEWVGEDVVRLFEVPMSHDRKAAKEAYNDICSQIAGYLSEGLRVVVAVEGDISIYASTHYIMDRLQESGVAVEQIPGIPSFIAAAAAANLSLVSKDQHLVVLPGDADAELLEQKLTGNNVVVIMKLSQCGQQLKEYLNGHKDARCHYFENVGLDDAFHTTDTQVIMERTFPYFSLAILYPDA